MAEQGHKVVGIARTSDPTPTLAGRGPVRGRAPAQAMTMDTERLRELATELGFWPATTEEADIVRHRQHNKKADYWLARRHRFDHLRREHERRRQRQNPAAG
jgi:hypothetical protein